MSDKKPRRAVKSPCSILFNNWKKQFGNNVYLSRTTHRCLEKVYKQCGTNLVREFLICMLKDRMWSLELTWKDREFVENFFLGQKEATIYPDHLKVAMKYYNRTVYLPRFIKWSQQLCDS